MQSLLVKRVYELKAETDGYRVLVDRLWPRGLTKENVAADEWLKEIAPSTGLRKWFHSDAGNWEQFKHRYLLELKDNTAVEKLRMLIRKHQMVTLLYSVKNEMHNHAIILKEYLESVE